MLFGEKALKLVQTVSLRGLKFYNSNHGALHLELSTDRRHILILRNHSIIVSKLL